MAAVWEIFDGPWRWGWSDCAACACRVFERLTGVNPMRGLRYSTEAGAARLVRRMGGWERMGARLAARSGLVPCGDVPGALGLVRPDLGAGLAIYTGDCWAKRIEGGIRFLPPHQMGARWCLKP